MEKPIIIFGAGSLGRMVLGILRSHDFDVYGFLDDVVDPDSMIDNVPVLGKTDDQGYIKLIDKKAQVVVALEDLSERKRIIDFLKDVRKTVPMNAIHSSVSLPENRSIGHGNIIGAGVIMEPGFYLGSHSVIHSGSLLGTNARIEDFGTIGSGTVVGYDCKLGEQVFVGAGSTVVPGIRVGDNSSIGAGSVVIQHVSEGKQVFGNPANEIS